jgi:hypothetical protein
MMIWPLLKSQRNHAARIIQFRVLSHVGFGWIIALIAQKVDKRLDFGLLETLFARGQSGQ